MPSHLVEWLLLQFLFLAINEMGFYLVIMETFQLHYKLFYNLILLDDLAYHKLIN